MSCHVYVNQNDEPVCREHGHQCAEVDRLKAKTAERFGPFGIEMDIFNELSDMWREADK